jgi:hypothetical protein
MESRLQYRVRLVEANTGSIISASVKTYTMEDRGRLVRYPA